MLDRSGAVGFPPRAVLVALLSFVVAGPAGAQALMAEFDYAMPERFQIPVIIGGGSAIDAGEVYTAAPISPASWTVDFDACASTGSIATYEWRVEGVLEDVRASCAGFAHAFPAEGLYDVSLTVLDGIGGSQTLDDVIEVDDLLIVAFGDSYGSGEGVPDEPVPEGAYTFAQTRETARDVASAARNAAEQSFLAALSDFQVTSAQLNAALSAQSTFLAARDARDATCPLPVIPCADAVADLNIARIAFAAALLDIGLSNFGVGETTSIRSAIANLLAIAQGTLDLARDVRDAAVAALQAAEAELAAALAALEPEWQNARCHRSARSWQVRVAQALSNDPHTSVTLIHLACSGATIQSGLIGPYGGIVPVGAEMLAPQLERARELICGADCGVDDREVDTFLVSVGGNDANFSGVIEACVLGEPCFDQPVFDAAAEAALDLQCALQGLNPFVAPCVDRFTVLGGPQGPLDAANIFYNGTGEPPECGDPVKLDGCNGLDDLPNNYAKLHTDLEAAFDAEAASRVFLTGYPQLTFDENGDRCGWNALDDAATRQKNLPGVSEAEMAWAGDTVTGDLLATIADTEADYGWTFVDGHVAAFERHGYCSESGWLVRIPESFPVEASPYGSVHPNASGQYAYATAVLQAVPEPGPLAAGAAASVTLAWLGRRRSRWAARTPSSSPSRTRA